MRTVWKAGLKALFNHDKAIDYENSTLPSDEPYIKDFFKGYHKIWAEFATFWTPDQMRRLCKVWVEIATGNFEFNRAINSPESFDAFIDEFHFMRMRSFDAFGPSCCCLTEMGNAYHLTPDQAESPLVKEYNHVIGELDTIANDVCSFEKEFRDGTAFHTIGFMHHFYKLSWRVRPTACRLLDRRCQRALSCHRFLPRRRRCKRRT